jgi:hypothetical protein
VLQSAPCPLYGSLVAVGFALITTGYAAAALSFALYVPKLFPTRHE